MFDTDGALGVAQGGPKALIVALLGANVAVWATASGMLASYGI